MHQPSAEPRPSLYFPYRVYPAWTPSTPDCHDRQGVVIVGAGPIGLATALGLAQQGVACVVLTAERQVSEGSRAIVFTRRSMDILHQLGVAQAVARHGLPWRHGNSYYRGQRVFRMDAPHSEDERFFPMTNLQQPFLEDDLLAQVQAQPLIEMRWGNRLIGLQTQGQVVTLTVDTPAGAYALTCDWLVAADGARSAVRSLMGLGLEGASYEGRFVIADIQIDLPLPTERLAFFDPPWNPGNTVLMHREPQGIWRIDYQLPPGETPEQALAPASLRARINAQLAMIGHADRPWTLDWSSVYSARALTLPRYVHGPVLFAGDAAHLLPIFGVRGANTGVQDAQGLAWRLALVARGLAPAALLNSYSDERVAAAREIIAEAGKSTRFMTPPSRGFRLLRDAVLSLSLSEDFVKPLYHWRTSRPHDYADSALNDPGDDNTLFSAGPAVGSPLANVKLGAQGHVLDWVGHAIHLLYFDPQGLPQALQDEVAQWQRQGLPLRVVLVGCAQVGQGVDVAWADDEGRLRARYGVPHAGGAYLVRPDQHVCARWMQLDAARLRHAVNTALMRTGAPL